MWYFHVCYWSGKDKESLEQHRLCAVPLDTHHNYMIRHHFCSCCTLITDVEQFISDLESDFLLCSWIVPEVLDKLLKNSVSGLIHNGPCVLLYQLSREEKLPNTVT